MNTNDAKNFRNPAVIRKAGLSALNKELGVVGAVYFIRQFAVGQGDYTSERSRHLDKIPLDEVMRNIREHDAEQ